jgi:hypothetical protein
VIGKSEFMVVDGRQQGPFDIVGVPVFSREGRHLAYLAGLGDKWFIVMDGKKGRTYDFILGSTRGGVYFETENSLYYLAMQGDEVYLVEEKLQ